MSTWLHAQTVPDNYRLNNALNKSYRRTRINCYRSRTDVTSEHIWTAFSWYKLNRLSEDAENEIPSDNASLHYVTRAVARGVSTETAVNDANILIQNYLRDASNTIITFNTATAAAGSQALKEMLDADEAYTELNVRTMLTSAPNHKIHIYKCNKEDHRCYVILNNIDSPSVLFKIAAAIMLDMDHFNDTEVTKKFAEVWMTGQPDAIISVINDYFAEYDATKKEREFNKTLNTLISNLSEKKLRVYKAEITAAEDHITMLYNEIETATRALNEKKGKYLLYLTREEDKHAKDLVTFLKSCDKNITALKIENNITLTVVYHTTLMYYDPELLDHYFHSTRGNIVTEAAEWKQQLMKDIFMEQKYKLHIESTIAINLSENSFRYAPLEYYVETEARVGIPNPHHKYFNCWGDNESRIRRAISNADYITALTTAFAAMSGLNLSDTAVVNKFLSEELYYADYANTPCLEDTETGELISIMEYERRFSNASNETNE